ncbi:MAG: penicillin-binding protein 1C [Myxococcaceae bacterium]
MSAVAEPPSPRPSSRLRQWIRRGAVAVGGVLGLALAASALWIAQPLPEGMLDYRPVSSVRILDRGGHLLRELRSRQDGRSTPIPGEEIPAHLRAAFIAAEDERFFSHPGVDPLAIARAAWSNLRAGRIVAGGSTMTQQLARVLVPRRRTLAGKVQEALWAMRLELHLTKEEILTQYLNRIPFGNGTFGIEAASQLYFARRTQFLSLGQAAVLAAIPRGPTAYDPYRRPARLEARRRWVLDRLVRTGAVSPEDASREKEAPLDLHAFSSTFRAPHLVEYVARNLDAWGLGEATSIETTIDPELQASVEQAVAQEIRRLGEKNVGSAAAIAVDNRTGEVLAYVGSADFFDVEHEGQNDGVQMRRQPGSALKPFAYVEAFSSGMTPATVLADTEAQFAGRSGVYSPENYDRRTHGPIRAREALANSYNVPAVRVAEQLGPERLLRALRQAGFDSLDKGSEHYGLGLVLGDGEVSLWHAARAYAGLSRGGVLRPLRVVRRALRPDGTELPVSDELVPRRFAAEVPVALVTDVLADNDARGRAFGLDSVLRLPFPVAAKTGTSKGYADNWTVGYTRERTVAVWAGNFDGSPMQGVSGISGAGPIFREVILHAMRGMAPAPLVPSKLLERARICPLSGERATEHCPAGMDEVFARGAAPSHSCAMHAPIARELDPDLARRCAELAGPRGAVTDFGPDYYDWARAEGLAREPWLAALCRGRAPEAEPTGDDALRFVLPASGAEYLLFPDLPLEDQTLPVRIRAAPGEGMLEVRLNGELLFSLEPPFVGRVPARKGQHRLTLHRPGDARPLAHVEFTVRTEQRAF